MVSFFSFFTKQKNGRWMKGKQKAKEKLIPLKWKKNFRAYIQMWFMDLFSYLSHTSDARFCEHCNATYSKNDPVEFEMWKQFFSATRKLF